MLLADQLYEELQKALQNYRKTRTPESLMNSSANRPFEYLNLHTSATYFVESEMINIKNDLSSSELKQLCDLSILLMGFLNYLAAENSQRLIALLQPIKTNLWDTGAVTDLLSFNSTFATAINNVAQLIRLNSSLYNQWQFNKINPLLSEVPCYRSSQNAIPEADMGPRYAAFIQERSSRAILANFW